jgi:L-seryl-tRNA(Ser) seleniumtransferase
MARSSARLREVGTTNRTRIDDYRSAIGPDTRLLLRVHPSNFRIVGFTARPTLEELVALGRETNIPVAEDLGSGCLYDVAPHGMSGEPPVTASLQAGADLVTFSGDKLLGGPQAGIIAGKADVIARIRRNPLFRMLRVDKLTYAALEATLTDYLFERYDGIPVLRMIRTSPAELEQRACKLAAALNEIPGLTAETKPGESVLGGGSTPGQSLPTTVVAVSPPGALSTAQLEQRLRQGDPAIIVRIEDGRVLIDPRTLTADDEFALIRGFRVTRGT